MVQDAKGMVHVKGSPPDIDTEQTSLELIVKQRRKHSTGFVMTDVIVTDLVVRLDELR
jgi:hypothetical protein